MLPLDRDDVGLTKRCDMSPQTTREAMGKLRKPQKHDMTGGNWLYMPGGALAKYMKGTKGYLCVLTMPNHRIESSTEDKRCRRAVGHGPEA